MPMLTRICTSIVLLGLALNALAFEPGREKICTPSADGQTFECRDKSDTSIPAVKATPVEPRPTVQTPVPARRAATSAPPTRQLPNYLMQNPSAKTSAIPIEPASAEAATPIETASSAEAAPTPAVQAPPVEATAVAESTPSEGSAPASPTVSAPEPLASEPLPLASAAVDSTPVVETPAEHQQPAAVEQAAERPATTRSNLPGASEFLNLPASHYTLVLASVRDAAALDGLILTLDNLPGQLFLLKLGMPDGDWYSLCWSNYADLDAARAARFSLPSDAAITSGWPRRIGLLQKELTR